MPRLGYHNVTREKANQRPGRLNVPVHPDDALEQKTQRIVESIQGGASMTMETIQRVFGVWIGSDVAKIRKMLRDCEKSGLISIQTEQIETDNGYSNRNIYLPPKRRRKPKIC